MIWQTGGNAEARIESTTSSLCTLVRPDRVQYRCLRDDRLNVGPVDSRIPVDSRMLPKAGSENVVANVQ